MKVPRRSLLAIAVGFLFPGFRSDSKPTSPPPELRLTKKPAEESAPLRDPCAIGLTGRPEYICPIHGDIHTWVLRYKLPIEGGELGSDTFCCLCIFDQLKKLPIARLGDD
jgi:hypothetical protein